MMPVVSTSYSTQLLRTQQVCDMQVQRFCQYQSYIELLDIGLCFAAETA